LDEDDFDPRARNVQVATASAAAAEEEPLEGEAGPVDWDAFKLPGSDLKYLKDADLTRASEAERQVRGVWHLGLHDAINARAHFGKRADKGRLRQLDLRVEEMLTLYDEQLTDATFTMRNDPCRGLTVEQIYAACVLYRGDPESHPLPPPRLDPNMARIYVAVDSACGPARTSTPRRRAHAA
jgi:hypothetical protein